MLTFLVPDNLLKILVSYPSILEESSQDISPYVALYAYSITESTPTFTQLATSALPILLSISPDLALPGIVKLEVIILPCA
uniref:Uncharacterized protein n=1 Tax=Siphoviridae sp. ctiOl67 TaxID=2825622 RepID=A0A8S5QKD8_9CAUD|nr:MAG TPA: hypothetical protein [Siphoviridae sp. ctiOl67]